VTVTPLLDIVVDVHPDAPPETRPTIERRGHSTMPNERSDDTPPASPDARPLFADVMAAFSEASLRLRPAVDPGKTDETDETDETGEAEAV
jgi:hypothetical protein